MLGKLHENNQLKICYICIVLVSSYQIYIENIAADVKILRLLFDTNLALIPYLLICLIGYFTLFTESGSKFTDNKRFIFGIACVLVISAVVLTYAGGLDCLDYSNDNDEALEAWIHAFFSGTYPYEARSNLGNLITPFPFLPLYSIPYYILGDVAIQNIVNIFILLYILRGLSSNRDQLKFGLVAFFISLPVYYFLLTQSDHFTVATLTALGIYLLHKNKFTAGSILFGCLIASKGYVWLFIPTTLYFIKYKEGYKGMIKSTLIYILVSSIFILPFVLWNPHVFFTQAPFGAEKGILSGVPLLPYPAYSISAITIILSLLTFRKTKNLFIAFFSTYIFFGLFLFRKVMFLITLSAILLGLDIHNKKQQEKDITEAKIK